MKKNSGGIGNFNNYQYLRYFFYPRIILSEELTNTRAAAIGTITITTARKMLLKKALNDGVINRTLNHKLNFNDNYSTRLELQFINLTTCHSSTN